ncbi:MAG: type II toxin-antitoxin system VapC family toxin [Candidatus Jacksonbacteria bacterium]
MKIIKQQPYILDASVAVKWFAGAGEEHLDKALALFNLVVARKITFLAPELLVYELSNALWKGKNFNNRQLNEAMKAFYALSVELFSANMILLQKAHQIAVDYNITVYDATYAALAELKECSLITANPKCFKRVKKNFIIVLDEVSF